MTRVLRLDSSARGDASVSRDLSARLALRLADRPQDVTVRDLAATPPAFVDEAWAAATFTDPAERTPAQAATLSASDDLVAELEAADQIVIGVAIYNFNIAASLKAWIDQIARARRTFRYTEAGPEGLLKGKTAWLVVASGGTTLESEIDFATPYLKHILAFVGITDVRVIDATRWGFRTEEEKAAVFSDVEGARASAA